jgi:hypothetical protein
LKKILSLILSFFIPLSFSILHSTSFLPSISAENNFMNDIGRPDSLNMKLVGMWNVGYPFAIHTSNGYLYLGSGGSVIIFNVSDTTNPEQIGNISFPGAHVRGIYVLDTLMFVADQERGLRIANISDQSNPFEVGSYDSSWTHAVFARANLVYTTESSNLVIYDISNPEQPVLLSKHTMPKPHGVDVIVKDEYAYVADGQGGLRIINVSDSTNPFETGNFTPVGYIYALSLYCDSIILLATEPVPQHNYCGGLWIVNIKDPYNPYPMGCDTSFLDAMDVSYFSHYAYVSSWTEGIKVIDFNDPSNPYIIGEFLPPGYTWNIVNTNIGPYIYAGEWRGNGLRTIDASEPTQPVTIDYDLLPDDCMDVAIKENYAYVANSCSGIYTLDISDPNNPKEVSHYDTGCRSNSIVIKDSIAYIADSASILLLDISNPSNPEKISELPLNCGGYGLDLDYPYLYVTSAWESYFAIIDVSNPQSPLVTGICYLDNNPTYICYKDTFAYVSGTGGAVINIKDVYNPTLETYCSGCSRGIDCRGNYLYAAGDTIINILDISDPANPILVSSFLTVRDYPFELTIKDSLLYVALQIVGVEVFDISSPLTPISVGYYCGPPLSIPLGIGISDDLVYLAADNGIFIFEYTGGTGKEEEKIQYKNETLSFKCYPTTFSKNIKIELVTEKRENIKLQVYDASGRLCKKLVDKKLDKGSYSYNWNSKEYANGIYFSVLNVGEKKFTQKIVKIK